MTSQALLRNACKMACCSPKCRAIFMLCYGIVGIAIGLLVAVIFLSHPQLRNIHAGIWGFLSFVCAGCVSFYGLLRWKFWLCLRRVTLLCVVAGAGGTATGTVGFIAYIVCGATDTGECHQWCVCIMHCMERPILWEPPNST